jgi:hypothetical protein
MTLAKKGTAKYREQVWAGLIDDPQTLAEEREARAAAIEAAARIHPGLPTGAREVLAAKAATLRKTAKEKRA